MWLFRINYEKIIANPDEPSAKFRCEQDLYDILEY